LILAYIVKKNSPKLKSFATIFMLSAASAIIFGFVFGEFFGAESIGHYHLPHLIHRVEDLTAMFMIAVGIGIVHLNLGLVFGMINEAHEGVAQAIVKKGSWMLLQVGVIMLLATFGMLSDLPVFSQIPGSLPIGAVLTAIAVIGIWHGERIKGLVEIFSIFSNIMSYTRLVALGLASVYLALVVNQIGGDLFHKGGIWIVVGVLILLIGHTINLILGLLGPFLHSLRLHYVEFFMKFYEGGGKQYKPFGSIQ
jgi:V/A-type H+/Na+-transporting ATPase subunit I